MKKFKIITLGCRTNQYETEALRQQFLSIGLEPASEGERSDLCIINTCAVTEQAEVSSRHSIRSIISQNKEACIVVTGCLAQKESQAILAMPGVTHVIGNEDKERICEILFPEIPPPLFAIKQFSDHTRAFVKIQDGCNHFCAYCTVPYLRGRSRSRTISSIIDEVIDLVAGGHKEIVITGVNVGDFEDSGKTLSDLLRALDTISGIERLRISSINPNEVSDNLINTILGGRAICPSMHLVLQSGSSAILQRMRRPYNRELFFRIVDTLRSRCPDFTFTTDLIVGFPGESDFDFEESLETIRQIEFAKVHMFPYSRRPKTLAARFTDSVPIEVIKERKHRVLSLADEVAFTWRNRFVGRIVQVLTEDGATSGLTVHGISVNIENEKIQSNTLVDVRIIGNSPIGLIGALMRVD